MYQRPDERVKRATGRRQVVRSGLDQTVRRMASSSAAGVLDGSGSPSLVVAEAVVDAVVGERVGRQSSSSSPAPAIVAASARPAASSSVGRPSPSSRNGLYSAAAVFERLAGEGLEGRPALALLAGRDVRRRARPGRDELADDDVLLEADQVVLGAVDGGLGQHPGRLLEGRRGEEADDVLSDALVTPSRTVWAVAGSPPSARTRLLCLLELEAVDQLGRQQVDVARLVDADLAEHLPDDDLDVLVVDRDALAPVDLLDLLDQVALDGVLAPGVEVLLRVDRAVGDRVAGPDLLAVLDQELGVVRDRVLALDDVLGADDEAVVGP